MKNVQVNSSAGKVSFSADMISILNEYDQYVERAVQDAIEVCAEDTKEEIVRNSPEGHTGRYAKDWAVKKIWKGRHFTAIVHNKKHYRLTHLLERGHDVVNKNHVKIGYSPAHQHIAPAERKAEKELMQKLERLFKEGY